MQQLWAQELDWDVSLSPEQVQLWNEFQTQFEDIKNIKVPRHVTNLESAQSYELHGFCDASEKAYAACMMYLCEVYKGF